MIRPGNSADSCEIFKVDAAGVSVFGSAICGAAGPVVNACRGDTSSEPDISFKKISLQRWPRCPIAGYTATRDCPNKGVTAAAKHTTGHDEGQIMSEPA